MEEKQLPAKKYFLSPPSEAAIPPLRPGCPRVNVSNTADLSDSQSEVSQLIKNFGAEVFHRLMGHSPEGL
jgi:hypothetical protein